MRNENGTGKRAVLLRAGLVVLVAAAAQWSCAGSDEGEPAASSGAAAFVWDGAGAGGVAPHGHVAQPLAWAGEARSGPLALPGASVIGRFEGEIDPFGGPSSLRFIPADDKSAAVPGVGRSPRTGTQLLLEQDVDVLGYSEEECGESYWNARWAEEGSAWRFWLDEGTPRSSFFQRLVNGPPDSDGEDALRFCTEFTLRNISSNTYGDLWLMFDGIALERGYAFVDSVPRRLEGLGPEGTDLEYAPVSDRGMFNYGPLAPSEEVSRQWYFYRAPGSALQRFRVSGDVVEILHEQCGNGQDNNGDGIPDSGCGLGSFQSNCYLNADCLSGSCEGSVLDPESVDAWVDGECAVSGLGQPCLLDTDCDGELTCADADPDTWQPGTCAEPPEPQPLGASCLSDEDCEEGTWCPTSTSEPRCSPLLAFPLGEDVLEMPFVWVPAGAATVGSPVGEVGRASPSEEQVDVVLTRNLFVQRTPLTQGQWAAVIGAWNALEPADRTMSGWSGPTEPFGLSPSRFEATGQCADDDCPVESVSWHEAVVFANALSVLEGLDECYTLTDCGATLPDALGAGCAADSCAGSFTCGSPTFVGPSCTGYRLPTEAEFEYAARAGTTTATYNGDLGGTTCALLGPTLNAIAWTPCNSGSQARPTAGLQPNAWGLYDVLGNVKEWTSNPWISPQPGGTDPVGPASGTSRTVRGGTFAYTAAWNRAALRNNYSLTTRRWYIGMRLVRSAPVEPGLSCGFPDSPANGSTSGVSVAFQAVVNYECDPGFTLVGNSQRICLATGEWSGEVPVCEPD